MKDAEDKIAEARKATDESIKSLTSPLIRKKKFLEAAIVKKVYNEARDTVIEAKKMAGWSREYKWKGEAYYSSCY